MDHRSTKPQGPLTTYIRSLSSLTIAHDEAAEAGPVEFVSLLIGRVGRVGLVTRVHVVVELLKGEGRQHVDGRTAREQDEHTANTHVT